ncbi:S-adenosylmethionine-dependent methyltransferase Rv2258c-like [Saccostrea echinata]|uniref:S-adenosylmethionine-dependent methyltransferase Rv2258c-like n=1 Tax=Saccostrea echinata TaxID=191078 RepID=UPI002A8132B1|nr:S-adenosylmethionine-dependent methyltransferase Rv2258c-like [Saccostrea echinata]
MASHKDLMQMVRDGLGTLVFAFGHKVGIIDAFIELKDPCTVEELSQKSGLNSRYIQEWLGCMLAAGVVRINKEKKYSLPYSKDLLKRWGHIASVIPIFSELFGKLAEDMSKEKPEGYTYYQPFLKWLDIFQTPEAVHSWNNNLVIPVLNLKSGKDFTLLDLGCGYGRHVRDIAEQYPDCHIFGIDSDEESIKQANIELAKTTLQNVKYEIMDGGKLPDDWVGKFDFVIMNDVLHDAYEVDSILKETKKVLKDDGYGAAFDPPVSSYPENLVNDKTAQFYMPFSLFSCLPESLSGPPGGEGLGAGWGYERRKEKIEKHGFQVIKVHKDVDKVQDGIVFKK